MIDMPCGMWTRGVVVAQRTVLQMGFILAPPGEYDGAICEVAPMRAIATITTADSPTSRSHILGVKVSCYLLVIVLPTNCVSPPGKHLIPLSLSTCLNLFFTIFHPDPSVLPMSLPDQPVLLATRAFSVSAPSTWNSLPAHIRSIDTLSTFKRHLKFDLLQPAFTVSSSFASASDSFSQFLALVVENYGFCYTRPLFVESSHVATQSAYLITLTF